jgi:hypothetical protein
MDAFTRRVASGGALRFCVRLAVAAFCVGGLARPACAQYYWATTGTGLWTTGANWSSNATSGGPYGTVPTDSRTTHTAYFNQSSVNGDTTVELSGSRSILGMVFNNTGSTLIRASASGTQSLSVGQGGMTVNAGAGSVTIGDATNTVPMIIYPNAGASSITNHSSSLLRFVNGINNLSSPLTFTGTGTGGVQVDGNYGGSAFVKSGSGTLVFTGVMGISTGTISSGTLAITGAGVIGSGTWGNSPYLSGGLTNNGAFVYSSSARSAWTPCPARAP